MLTSRSFALLSCKSDGFSYPMILSVSGMAFSSLAVAALDKAAPRLVQRPRVSWRQYARTFLPIGALMAVTLALGNIAYLHLSVAMIQIRRLVRKEKTATIVVYFSLTSSLIALLSLPFGWVFIPLINCRATDRINKNNFPLRSRTAGRPRTCIAPIRAADR